MFNIEQRAQIAVVKNITPFTGRPSEESRFLIQRNLDQLIELIIKDANEFSNTNQLKLKALGQLFSTIIMAENNVKTHIDGIIQVVSKNMFHEDPLIAQKAQQIAELIGIFVGAEICVKILVKQIYELDSSSVKQMNSLLVFLALSLQNENQSTIEPFLNQLSGLIGHIDDTYNENLEIQESLYELTHVLVNISGEYNSIYVRKYFSVLLSIQSNPALKQERKNSIMRTMEQLAISCGYQNVHELHSNEVSIFLQEFNESENYKKWTKFSNDRYKFEVIIRNCQEGIARYLDVIVKIMAYLCNPENDVQLRMDILILVEFIFNQQKLHEELKNFSEDILTQILIPAAIWRVGKANIKIRKAGVINIITMININVISPNQLHQHLNELIPVLKSCLNDDWGPDLRYATCNLVEKILQHCQHQINEDELREMYPALLEKLDDAQDVIRIEITKSFIAFFQCTNGRLSNSTFEYTVKAIFIHLDDHNEDLQNQIYKVLVEASNIDSQFVLQEAHKQIQKQKQPRRCQELINLIENKIQ